MIYFKQINSELVLPRKKTAQFNSARNIKQMQSLSLKFDKCFIDFASVEPIATYMCFLFATYINVEDIASKIGALFQLNIAAVENEMLSLQNDIEMKSRASTEREKIWKLLLEEKHPNIKICALYTVYYPVLDQTTCANLYFLT